MTEPAIRVESHPIPPDIQADIQRNLEIGRRVRAARAVENLDASAGRLHVLSNTRPMVWLRVAIFGAAMALCIIMGTLVGMAALSVGAKAAIVAATVVAAALMRWLSIAKMW